MQISRIGRFPSAQELDFIKQDVSLILKKVNEALKVARDALKTLLKLRDAIGTLKQCNF